MDQDWRSRRAALCALNQSPAGLSDLRTLDGSIKKNTAFVRKLRSFTAADLDALMRESQTLKLEKYVQEVASALLECMCSYRQRNHVLAKLKQAADIHAAVELCSALHQRFPSFSPAIVQLARKMIHPPPTYQGIPQDQKDKDELVRIQKHKTALRLLTEFNLVKLFDPKRLKSAQLQNVLEEMFTIDKELCNITLASSFLKSYSSIFLDAENTLATESEKKFVVQLFNTYFEQVSRTLIRVHQKIKDVEKFNHEFLMTKGELSEERKEKYQQMQNTFSKLNVHAKQLSECLAVQMPELPEDNATTRLGIGITENSHEEQLGEFGIWDDEESKLFYSDIIDLKDCVPVALLGEKKSQVHVAEVVDVVLDIGIDVDEEDGLEYTEEEEKQVTTSTPTQTSLDALFIRLLNAQNTTTLDQIIIDYMYLHSKYAKNKLVNALLAVPKQRTDLIPFYCRLIATLNPYIPDIGTAVSEYLEKEVKKLFRKSAPHLFQEKIKVVRYIGELVKFRIAPWYLIFGCLTYLFNDFTSTNVELFTTLLDTCGRFLYKLPLTQERIVGLVDGMMRMKVTKNLGPREVLLIDNAFYSVYPPDQSAFQHIYVSPVEMYARYLIYELLDVSTAETVLNQLLKFNWKDEETLCILKKCFYSVWKVKFSNLDCLVWLVAELFPFYPEFCVGVVDETMEAIRVGLEKNLFKDNQKRIATIKFLGELYNYCIVSSTLIFDTLFFILRFGHEGGIARPDVSSALDANYDFFRVRLVCVLLDACGKCFSRGKTAIKLDQFLVFFQMYIFTKVEMPMEIEFVVSDLFELLRPKMKIMGSYQETVEEVNRISMLQKASRPSKSEDNNQIDDDRDEMQHEDPDSESESESDSDDEEKVDTIPIQAIEEEEEEASFAAEYASLMNESLESRKFEKKPSGFDIPVPMKSKTITVTQQSDLYEENSGKVAFTVLSRKGNKQQSKTVELPSTSSFVVNTQSKHVAEQLEKKRLKEIVLDYEAREYSDAPTPIPPIVPTPKQTQRTRRLGDTDTNALFEPRGYYS